VRHRLAGPYLRDSVRLRKALPGSA
jgi:hypothetical protein